MKRKALWKVFGAGMLTLSMALAPAAALNVQAATVTPPTEEKMGDKEEGKGPTDKVEIPVWGFSATLDGAKIYSVDVEWGAMTFQYSTGGTQVWDPATHTYKSSASSTKNWYVYDSKNKGILETDKSAINQISVTNHSNAKISANLSYTTADMQPTTGSFITGSTSGGTGTGTAVMTLDSAAANVTEQNPTGKEVTDSVYFMLSGTMNAPATPGATVDWSQLGTITVGIDAVP